MTTPLPIHKLRARLAPEAVPYADSGEIPNDPAALAKTQPRALSALTTSLRIPGNEYNIYLAGDPRQGRTYFARSFLDPAALDRPAPADWIYVYNFEDQDKPQAISLPAGEGRKFKAALAKAVTAMREEIPARFEQEAYLSRKQALVRGFTVDRDRLFVDLEKKAKGEGFNLVMDDRGALTLYPLIEGKVISDEEYDRMDPDVRGALKAKGDALLEGMGSVLRQISKDERGYRDREKTLDRDTAAEAADAALAGLKRRYAKNKALGAYLKALREDVLDNIEAFAPREPSRENASSQSSPGPLSGDGPGGGPGYGQGYAEDVLARYEANLFVDNSRNKGAPVILEDHPTYFNLMGCIERETELGALYTDFSLIKAGSLHRANGGFLIVKVDDLLQNQTAWEGLLRALRSGRARIEDPSDGEHARARTIEPEPIPLDLKVVLVGSDETYEMLLYGDERFEKLFKLKAHLQESMPRTPENLTLYFLLIGRIIRETNLTPFSRDALAALADYASLTAEDQEKLSLKLPLVREIMIEGSSLAKAGGKDMTDAAMLGEVIRARSFRANLFEEEFLAEYDREMIKVATKGEAVGRANGLSVRMFGDHAFGLPHQIACTVGVGHGGIMDLEREAELGGPIHTKGMMILKNYLLGLFAQDKPLVMTGSLCFEQSYAEVEGDSASAAELAALLSALAERPIRLRYAFTGAVSQSGAILAVGGLNEKIEGFFAVCARRGLTGDQGVLIPKDNVVNLMLKDEVVEAVAAGRFFIFPVTTIEEALEILTGMPAGVRGPNGAFPPQTLYSLVDERLTRLARLAAKYSRPGDCN